jgi:hypothetical protein
MWLPSSSVASLRNDHGWIPALGGRRWSCATDPRQEKGIEVKIKLLAKAIPDGGYFCNLAGETHHEIQPGGFQQDSL